MTGLIPLLLAVFAGIFTAIEVSINAKLGKIITPNIATLHSLITGAIIVLIANVVKGTINQYGKIIYISPQWLIGGIFGTLIIYFATKTIPYLGVSNTLTIIVASQIICGLMIDMLVSKQFLHLDKLLGVVMLLISVYFILK